MKGIFFEGDIESNYFGHQFSEIFKDRLYHPYLVDRKDLTILDIGANVGIFSLFVSPFAKQVIALEPAKKHFNTFNYMLTFNKITNVKPINKALYFEKTTLPFYHNKNQTMYSLFQTIDDATEKPEMVETTTLDELFTDEKIEHVDLLKMDIEGSEIEVLGGAGFKAVAPKIDTIVLEMHAWAHRNPNQIKEALRNNGFKVSIAPSSADIVVGTK